MAEADIATIGIAYDTSQLVTGSRQVQTAMQQLVQAERQADSASEQLARSSTQTAQAMHQESQAAQRASQAMQQTGQSTRGLTQQEQALAQALAQNSQALARNTQAIQQAGQATATMGQQARQAQGVMGELQRSLTGLVASAIAIQTLRSAFEGVVQAALKMEALTAAFTAITGSSQGAAAAIGFVRETANRLGVDVTSLAGSYKTLLAATDGTKLSLKDTQTLFLGITEAGRAMQLSSEDIVGAIRPIGQILNQQAIQGDEWRNEFGSRIPKAMQLLLEATGGAVKGQGELSKAMEEGKLKGEVVYDIMANLGELLRNKYAPAAQAAAEGTGASFARLQTAVSELQAAIGQGLNPALAEAARALTQFINLGKEGAGAFGGQFSDVIRQMTSALVGLAGGAVLAGKAVALLGVAFTFDRGAVEAGREDIKQYASDLVDLQTKILSGGFAQQPSAPMPAPAANLRPITLGSGAEEKQRRGLTEAEKEGNRVLQEQKSLREGINDAYEKALHTERELTELQLQRAGIGDKERAALMTRYDETQVLKEMTDEDKQRAALAKELQEAYNKATMSERELLELKLQSLHASKEETAERLKTYDATKQLTQAAEDKKRADEEAVQATKEQARELERLFRQLEPRRRRMTRAEQLQETFGELADVTSDPYQLAKADIQMRETLDTERWYDFRDAGLEAMSDLSSALTDFVFKGKGSFTDFANHAIEQFFRLASETAFRALFNTDMVQGLFKTGLKILGAIGGGGSAAGSAGAFVGGDFPGGQFGGTALAGRPMWVGEAGPELIIPKTTSTIIPHAQSMQLAAPTINVNFHGVTDMTSFTQSRGAVHRGIAQAVQASYRAL